MFDRIPLNLCLNRSLFNALLGKVNSSDYADTKQFKHVDLNVANSLKFILENDLTDYEDTLGIYFNVTHETNLSEIDLKPNGSNIPITNVNKHEFA